MGVIVERLEGHQKTAALGTLHKDVRAIVRRALEQDFDLIRVGGHRLALWGKKYHRDATEGVVPIPERKVKGRTIANFEAALKRAGYDPNGRKRAERPVLPRHRFLRDARGGCAICGKGAEEGNHKEEEVQVMEKAATTTSVGPPDEPAPSGSILTRDAAQRLGVSTITVMKWAKKIGARVDREHVLWDPVKRYFDENRETVNDYRRRQAVAQGKAKRKVPKRPRRRKAAAPKQKDTDRMAAGVTALRARVAEGTPEEIQETLVEILKVADALDRMAEAARAQAKDLRMLAGRVREDLQGYRIQAEATVKAETKAGLEKLLAQIDRGER